MYTAFSRVLWVILVNYWIWGVMGTSELEPSWPDVQVVWAVLEFLANVRNEGSFGRDSALNLWSLAKFR